MTRVLHVSDRFGDEPRHQAARFTWESAYADGMIRVTPAQPYVRDARAELGDPRALPFLKEILQAGVLAMREDDDVLCWTNSDVGFAPGATAVIGEHVAKHGAASMRRTESNGQNHIGRDLFAFTLKWLRTHWNELPDYVIGIPVFDLGLVAMIRLHAGIRTPLTTKNLGTDMPPADMPPGYALHRSHVPEWHVRSYHALPAMRHNHRLFYEWAQRYMPAMKFTKGHNLL